MAERAAGKNFYKISKDKNIVGNQTYQEFLFSFLGIEPIRKANTDVEEEENNKEERLIFIYKIFYHFCGSSRSMDRYSSYKSEI